jgi:hypothetical protein
VAKLGVPVAAPLIGLAVTFLILHSTWRPWENGQGVSAMPLDRSGYLREALGAGGGFAVRWRPRRSHAGSSRSCWAGVKKLR